MTFVKQSMMLEWGKFAQNGPLYPESAWRGGGLSRLRVKQTQGKAIYTLPTVHFTQSTLRGSKADPDPD